MPMTVPVHVEGHDVDGKPWTEMTRCVDASMGGLCFNLRHQVDRGSLLHLAVPLPKRFRRYDPASQSYRVFALVRDVEGDGPCRVGVVFMGQQPPKAHFQNPGMRYRMTGDAPARRERRGERRLDIYMNVKVRRLSGQEERTIAENLGRHGARTLTSLPVDKGEVVEFEEIDGAFRTRAEVRNLYVGEDRIPRLNLRFLDSDTPDRLLPAS